MSPVNTLPMAISGAACEQINSALSSLAPDLASAASISESTSAMMAASAVATRLCSWEMVSPRVEGTTCGGLYSAWMTAGKWVANVAADAGEGWSK